MSNWMRAAGRRFSGSALGDAMVVAYQTRTTGLAAEASFWAVFALPWLILGLVAGMSRVQVALDVDAVDSFRASVLDLADQVLTPEAIDDLVVPLLDSVFGRGQATLGLVGVVIAVWAGSRVIDTLVNAMTIVYQREGLRSFVQGKLLSIGVYVAGLAVLIVAIPLILTGPSFLTRLVPGVQGSTSSALLTAAQIVVVLVLLVSLYHWAVPHRTRWAADIPGALVAMALWGVFSWLLRWYFAWIFREGSVYGAIAAPVAVMWWVYVTVLSLMLGAAFNGALAIRRGWFVHPRDGGPLPAPASDAEAVRAEAGDAEPQALPAAAGPTVGPGTNSGELSAEGAGTDPGAMGAGGAGTGPGATPSSDAGPEPGQPGPQAGPGGTGT